MDAQASSSRFGIAIVQQITGVNTIMYYGTQILTDAGFARTAR